MPLHTLVLAGGALVGSLVCWVIFTRLVAPLLAWLARALITLALWAGIGLVALLTLLILARGIL